ncbi:GNAT family N-acetyltransferase [Streptomyces sp. NPDC059853]|uniref:GNAT family N-acetyltransferase n=1 Tax=Streptomyces sp. NPDC059853 TaxID=3346973 RepID=UPI00364D29A0
MDTETVRARFDEQLRAHAAGGERSGPVVRVTRERGGWDGVVWSGLTEATADAAIADQIRYFTDLGRGFEWKWYAHDGPADLGDRLRAAGFVPDPPETLMAAEVAALPTVPVLPDGVALHRVTDDAGVELMLRAHRRAFGTDPAGLGAMVREQLASTPELIDVLVAVTDDGDPVSAARLERWPGTDFAGLWGGGTAPEWRGRGIYRALVAARAAIAAAHGVRYLQVDASDDSRPILRRLGFEELGTTVPYTYGDAGGAG